ncbi:TM2 domain-containing protein [Chenggangzhangella methanolivorans]|uniref:TM2 domain-containing protein n=1 Tax=Chenggangzhangella methanolivorans TaxID=1437009 RepID=UPI0021BDE812|nr:TM2 domain-containing protein [Chenggangzhangella methanolivorans]
MPRVTSHDALSEEAAPTARQTPPARKTMWVAYALQIMGGGGFLGLHRFYLGYKQSGYAQLALGVTTLFLPLIIGGNDFQYLLIPLALIWYLVDLFLIPGMVRRANGAES